MKRFVIAAAALAAGAAMVVGLFLASRPGNTPGETSKLMPRGEITIAYPDDPPSLNPFVEDSAATSDLLRPVFPTLLSIGPGQKFAPSLAVRVPSGKDITTDPFTVTFHLDRNAVWSDGTPVTAGDVKFTWQKILDPNVTVSNRQPYRRIKDVEVIDRHRLTLVFDKPYAAWPDLFSAGSFVVPRHALEGKDFAALFDKDVPGAGPFLIESYQPGLQIVYAANPLWWGRGPGLARATVQFVPSTEVALRLLEEGRVQALVVTTQLNLTGRIERITGAKAASGYGAMWWELAFNHSRPGPDLPGFRSGVARAIDRQGIVEALVRQEGRALESLAPGRGVPPAFAGLSHNPDEARALLRAAGFLENDGKFSKAGVPTIGLSTPEESEMGLILERAIFQGLRNLGLDVELRNPPGSVLYGKWRKDGTYDLAIWERRGSPSQAPLPHFHSTMAPPEGLNHYRLGSARVDAALDALENGVALSPAELGELMKLLAEDLPALPLFEAKAFVGFTQTVSGPDPNASADGPFWNLEKWALRPALRTDLPATAE